MVRAAGVAGRVLWGDEDDESLIWGDRWGGLLFLLLVVDVVWV